MRKQIAAIFLVSSMLLPVVGNAQGVNRNYGNDPFGRTKVYLGVKYGILEVDPDVSGSDTFDMDNMGFMFGGHFIKAAAFLLILRRVNARIRTNIRPGLS